MSVMIVVFEWLNETELLIQEVKNLMVQARTQQPDEFRKLVEKVKAHNMKFELLPFSTPIPSLEHFSSGIIVFFNSREKASNQLLVALKFDKNSEAGRAKRIFSMIESMNCPILVIFNDVRAKFDLEDVGIPCNSNRCKIVLTTCSRQDCDLMYCQREFQLDPLYREEAWILFMKHSCIRDDVEHTSLDLLNVAHELVKIMECMKLKNQFVWPIFYKVDPSDTRHLRNCYGRDMARHENNFGINSESKEMEDNFV
ncbi:disease resistance protein [Trifolium repens]|nr:disease resistance protein [Trifolium repens]